MNIHVLVGEPRKGPCSSCLSSIHGFAALTMAHYAIMRFVVLDLLEYRVEDLLRNHCSGHHLHFAVVKNEDLDGIGSCLMDVAVTG